MASLSTCHLGLWLGWQILLKMWSNLLSEGWLPRIATGIFIFHDLQYFSRYSFCLMLCPNMLDGISLICRKVALFQPDVSARCINMGQIYHFKSLIFNGKFKLTVSTFYIRPKVVRAVSTLPLISSSHYRSSVMKCPKIYNVCVLPTLCQLL